MLRLLARDAAAQQTVLGCLELKDFFSLMRSCKQWLAWIQRPPVRAAASLLIEGELPLLRHCFSATAPHSWLGGYIASVSVKDRPRYDASAKAKEKATPQQPTAPHSDGLAYDVCRWLPQAIRLTSVRFTMLRAHMKPGSLRDTVASLGATLTRLDVSVAGTHPNPMTRSAFDLLASLPLLTSVRFNVAANTFHPGELQETSYAPLLKLRFLTSWALVTNSYIHSLNRVNYQISPAQLKVLQQCPQLTSIENGSWEIVAGEEEAYDPLTLLLDSRDAANAPPLQHLDLSKNNLSHESWQRVQRISTLTRLEPMGWPEPMRAADWAPLRELKSLQVITIGYRKDWRAHRAPWIDSDVFLPPLLRCSQLTYLRLVHTTLIADQLAELFAACPIVKLHLSECVLPVLSAFAGAVRLSSLRLDQCTRALGGPMLVSTLPTLPRLSSLQVSEAYHADDRRSHEARQRAIDRKRARVESALRKRMPGLSQLSLQINSFDFTTSDFSYSAEEKVAAEWGDANGRGKTCALQ